jgi:hypothetical protein
VRPRKLIPCDNMRSRQGLFIKQRAARREVVDDSGAAASPSLGSLGSRGWSGGPTDGRGRSLLRLSAHAPCEHGLITAGRRPTAAALPLRQLRPAGDVCGRPERGRPSRSSAVSSYWSHHHCPGQFGAKSSVGQTSAYEGLCET